MYVVYVLKQIMKCVVVCAGIHCYIEQVELVIWGREWAVFEKI